MYLEHRWNFFLGEKKRKIIKPSEKFSRIFQFDWEETDDTARNDLNPLYNKRVKINALFGRGYIAGVDQKEQRKESNYLLTLSEKRMLEAQKLEEGDSHLTEEEKRIRAKARDRAKEEFRRKQQEEWKLIDKANDSKMGRHWSEKNLDVSLKLIINFAVNFLVIACACYFYS